MIAQWTTTRHEAELISIVVTRTIEILKGMKGVDKGLKLRLMMDVIACHSNGCPLELNELATANGMDLMHDVIGISNHINRETGELMDGFSPRYMKRGSK